MRSRLCGGLVPRCGVRGACDELERGGEGARLARRVATAMAGAACPAPQHLRSRHLPRSREGRGKASCRRCREPLCGVVTSIDFFVSFSAKRRWQAPCTMHTAAVFLTPPPPRPSFRLGEPTFRHGLLPFTDIPTRLRRPRLRRAAPHRPQGLPHSSRPPPPCRGCRGPPCLPRGGPHARLAPAAAAPLLAL